MPFQMTLSPGVMNGLSQPILISFTSPEVADRVTVTLFEADRWGTGEGQVTESTPNDQIAVFRGQIADHRFVRNQDSPGGGGSPEQPVLRVRFEGEVDDSDQPVTHELHIPTQRGEHENGVFEIIARVTGRIEGAMRNYQTAVPVFIRQWTGSRPVITFVTETSGGFFQGAQRYWTDHSDGLWTAPNNVEGILEQVRTAPGARGYGHWGEVNIVSHGNEDHWIIRPETSSRQAAHLTETEVAAMIQLPDRYQAPGEDALDDQSRVVLRGCAIGNCQPLLDRVRELFGNRASVFAPKYLQFYEFDGTDPRESLWNYYIAYVLTADANPDADTCIPALNAAYTGVTDEEWREMLGHAEGTRERPENDHETIPWPLSFEQDPRPVAEADGYDPTDPERLRAWLRQILDMNFDQATMEQTRGTSSGDWHWTIGTLGRSRGQWRAQCTGSRIRIELRRPLLDAADQPVTSDLTSRAHFGRSPAWP